MFMQVSVLRQKVKTLPGTSVNSKYLPVAYTLLSTITCFSVLKDACAHCKLFVHAVLGKIFDDSPQSMQLGCAEDRSCFADTSMM